MANLHSEANGTVELASGALRAEIWPDKGCDIVSLVDLASGVDVLFKTPWRPSPQPAAASGDSLSHWMASYPGGWQVLLPNGGAACTENGVEWGFHGEAAVIPWWVEEAGPSHARFGVDLFRAPLAVERAVELRGSGLHLTETVTNTSPDPVEVMWSHHPAFGPPLLASGAVLDVPVSMVIADDEAPGTMLEPGTSHSWPKARTVDGDELDLSIVPGPDEPRAHLAYLTGFTDGHYTISNLDLDLAVRVSWPLEVFPHAWFWQEIHSGAGYPWYRRAYATAIEPCTTYPGQGLTAARSKGGTPLRLAGGESRRVDIEVEVFRPSERSN
jgi:hypothetical protein